jgi:hypothetical protein
MGYIASCESKESDKGRDFEGICSNTYEVTNAEVLRKTTK